MKNVFTGNLGLDILSVETVRVLVEASPWTGGMEAKTLSVCF